MYGRSILAIVCLMFLVVPASAEDAWWKICRPLPQSAQPRRDPCAHETFRWAAQEVLRAPRVCVTKSVSLKDAVRAYKRAWQIVLCAPARRCDARESCREAVDAWHQAADELRRCHDCERQQAECDRCRCR